MSLYPKNENHQLENELFQNPTAEYRGTPFWAWNCKLQKDQLLRQIDQLKEMGMGGFHIHSRSGMDTEYLGDKFMDLVKSCNEKAKKEDMLCWLYDEDRWPSGAAGGILTKDVRYRARYLIFTPIEDARYQLSKEQFDLEINENKKPAGYFIAKYHVELSDGYLKSYKRIKDDKVADDENTWFAYMVIAKESSWYNNQTYVNTLDPHAIKKFVEITHDKYFEELGEDFGKSIPAIFTDEPQFPYKTKLNFAEQKASVNLPFTDDLSLTYQQTYGNDILDFMPELVWELPNGEISLARYRYHDHVSERFAAAFADIVGNWCSSHNIMLTGHMNAEASLSSQTVCLGEAMRSYRSFGLPGIDMLCDHREYSTAKQAQSASHQYGRPGVLSELYGVTNWDFDFKGHKLQGDWQAALGVTVRVHHLTWVSMEGEAKRDYPACIGYQSPWYKEYALIEDHFSRLNTALTRGKPIVRVGVIHPIESYWLYWGPEEQTAAIRENLNHNFQNIIKWLLFDLIDFDFIAESLLPSLCADGGQVPFTVGEMKYDVIIVPGNHTLRSTTIERLKAFKKAGGTVIFTDEAPKYVDGIASQQGENLARICKTIPFNQVDLVSALDPFREIEIRGETGKRSTNLFYQMRQDGDDRFLFICNVDKVKTINYNGENYIIKIKGKWQPTIYNTLDGTMSACPFEIKGNETIIKRTMHHHDSLLLHLAPTTKTVAEIFTPIQEINSVEINDPAQIKLSEPNVLLLDIAQYSLNNGAWQTEEELLRMDTTIRKELGYLGREGRSSAQPWVEYDETTPHLVKLKFTIKSDVEIEKPSLAIEHPEKAKIFVNGTLQNPKITGFFVDECIKTFEISKINVGMNEILVEIPFGVKTNIEWCYLLGDFGVKVNGRHCTLTNPVKQLAFGDWSNQGLPFYAGNVTYICTINANGKNCSLQVPKFNNPVLTVQVDGKKKGAIAFSPYILELGKLEKGTHTVEITAFGNRINAFGQVHNCVDGYSWWGPDSWRTKGNSYSYQYQLRQMGILTAPKMIEEK